MRTDCSAFHCAWVCTPVLVSAADHESYYDSAEESSYYETSEESDTEDELEQCMV